MAKATGREPGVRWVMVVCHLVLWLASAVHFWQPLFAGKVLMATSPKTLRPWMKAITSDEAEDIASNRLLVDGITLTYPWRTYNSEVLRRGEVPFWNPYIFCGYPHLAALQSNALYPPVALCDLIDPVAGVGWSMAFHLALAGSLMLVFLRRRGLGWQAALLGAVTFEFSGFFLVRMATPSYVFSGVWTPLLLLGLDEIASGRGWRSAWKVALAVAMAVMGGHPQIVVLQLVMGAAYLFVSCAGFGARTRSAKELFADLMSPLMVAGVAVALGLCLAGLQLLPFAELLTQSARGPVEWESVEKMALPPLVLAQAVIPDFFGNPVDGSYWLDEVTSLVDPHPEVRREWRLNYCGDNLFTGVVPLLLAVVAWWRSRRVVSLFFAVVGLYALLTVLGTPALQLAYWLVPTFRQARPDRMIFLYMLAVSVLAAYGWHDLSEGGPQETGVRGARWLRLSLPIVLGASLLWPVVVQPGWSGAYGDLFAQAAQHLRDNSRVVQAQVWEVVVVATVAALVMVLVVRRRNQRWISGGGVAVMVGLIVVQLFPFGWKFNPVQKPPLFPSSAGMDALVEQVAPLGRIARLRGGGILIPNTAQLYGLFDACGSSAAALDSYVRVIDQVDPGAVKKKKYFTSFSAEEAAESGALDLLGVRVVLSRAALPLPRNRGLSRYLGGPVYDNDDALDRFFLVGQVETYESPELGVRRLFDPDFDPRTTALVNVSGWQNEVIEPGGRPEPEDIVEVVSYAEHEIQLDVVAAGNRLLVSSEVDYPGWRSWVDGREVETMLVNTAFRGVVVPPGRHRVVQRFVPVSFYLGLVLSGCAAAVLLAIRIGVRRRSSSRRPGER